MVKEDPRNSSESSFGNKVSKLNVFPLIQIFFADSMEGNALNRQSAADTATLGFEGEEIGREIGFNFR